MLFNVDGGFNSCGDCYTTHVEPVGNSPPLWGFNIRIYIEPTVGDSADAFAVDYGLNVGGCVLGSDPTSACGLDIMALDACSLAICLPVCAIPNPGPGNDLDPTALAAFDACLMNEQSGTGACAPYVLAVGTDCETTDAAASILSQCSALASQDDGQAGSPAPTEASEVELLGLICGGADGGV